MAFIDVCSYPSYPLDAVSLPQICSFASNPWCISMLLFVSVTVHITTVHRSHTLVNAPRECAWRLFGHRFKANCAAEMRSSKSRFLINRLYFLPRNEYDVIRFVVTRQFLMQRERHHEQEGKKKEAEEEGKGEREGEKERERERDTHTHPHTEQRIGWIATKVLFLQLQILDF